MQVPTRSLYSTGSQQSPFGNRTRGSLVILKAAARPRVGEFMTSDVLISGGTVIDPSQGISEKKDVAVEGGRVASIENHISHGSAGKVIDARGLLVTPGLIDLHSHVARTVTRLSVDADDVGLARGSTTMVDA